MNEETLAEKQRSVLVNVERMEAQAALLHAQSIRARYEMRCLWELANGPDDFAVIELAGTARIGQTRATTQLIDAGRMVELFDGVLASLEAGRMSVHMSDLLLSLTRNCTEDVQQAVGVRLLPELERLNTTDARRRIAETILEVEAVLDPDAAAERERRAKAGRDVYVQPVEDGMCVVSSLLDNLTARRWAVDFDELVRAQTAVDKRDGSTRTAGQRRADVFAALPSQLLHLLQMIAKGDVSALLDLARLDPEAAEQVHILADQTGDLLAQVPAAAGSGAGTATDVCGLDAWALTKALLTLKVRDPRVLNVHVAMETLIDLDQRSGWVEGVGPISPYRARCLLPTTPLRRVVTDARSGLPLRIDQGLLPSQAPLDAETARQRLLALLGPVVVVDEAQTGHDPTRGLDELVALRDRTCTGIGCSRPARLCDDDHEKRFPEGPTAEWNLSNKSRRCHLAKHQGWTVARNTGDGSSTWISPLGHAYTRPSAWRPPTGLPDDVALPEPRLVTDTGSPPDSADDMYGRTLVEVSLVEGVPVPQKAPELPVPVTDWDPYAPF